MNEKTKAEVDATDLMGVGAALIEPRSVNGTAPFLVVPNTFKVESLEKLLPVPSRAKGNLQLLDIDAFIRYVNKHKDKPGAASAVNRPASTETAPAPDADDQQTVIYVDPIQSKFKAVFDAHASDAPGWGEFTATYDCPISPEWTTWTGHDGRKMNQEDFAFFIEQNILDVHEPTGAAMLELVTTLKSAKKVAFDSGIRLQDGQVQLKYHEENTTTAGAAGEMKIPEEIKLGLPVYVGGDPYAVMAKFRYRIDGTKLFLWYDLIRPHKILEAALGDLVKKVADGTGITPYEAKV